MAEFKYDFTKMAEGFVKTVKEIGMFVGRWIPVSERLPEITGWYLVTTGVYEVMHKWYSVSNGWEFAKDNVIAWCEYPEPYKTEEGEQTDG